MTSRGVDVTLGLSCDPISLSPLEQDEAILCTVDHILTKSFDKYTRKLILSDHQRFGLLSVLKEVIELLVVNLKKRAIHSET